MKSFRTIAASVVALVIAIGIATSASAAGFFVGSEEGNSTVAAGRTIDSSAFMAGSTVVVDGTIKGDLYCAGETVTINGVIEGDIICAGQTVTINGAVIGDIRVAGADITLGGTIGGSTLAVGSTINTTEGFTVGSDFIAGGETLNLDGSFGRDLLVGGTTTTLRGLVARDVSAASNTVTVDPSSKIDGNFWYQATQQTDVPTGTVAGSTVFEQAESSESGGFSLGNAFIGVLGMVLVTVVGVLLAPRFIHTAASLSVRDTLFAFLAGLTMVIITPIVAIISMITVVGLWLGFILLFIWLLLMLTAAIFASYYTGTLVLQKRATNAIAVAAVGASVLAIVLLIPVVNVLVGIAMVCIGVGMQIMHLKYQFSKDPYSIV